MLKAEKCDQAYTQRFTETEMLDLVRLANADARSVPEMVRLIVDRFMYGHSRRPSDENQFSDSGWARL